MIRLLVDESYAFDYLSILEIKHKMDNSNVPKNTNYLKCYEFLKGQFNDEKAFNDIIASEEYRECYEANLQTFKAVDLAKTDSVKASYVDISNYRRHTAKQSLQKKFFNSDITETKIGYEVYREKDGVNENV